MSENPSSPWYERDDFWNTIESFLFGEERVTLASEQVDQILALTGISSSSAVLDLCCGVGRHSLELARRGFRVTGVDRTTQYLDRARARAQAENLDVEFVHEDMRRFCRENTFDAAINLFTSFGYFDDPEDDERVVAHVCESLRLGGVFVIDTHGKETLARIFRERDWHRTILDGQETLMLEERHVGENWSQMTNRWIFIQEEARHEFQFSHRIYAATELMRLLTDCGFSSAEAYGHFSGVPYDHNAKRLVVVGRK